MSRVGREQGLFRSTLSLILLTSLAAVAVAAIFGVCKVLYRYDSPSTREDEKKKLEPLGLPLPFPPYPPTHSFPLLRGGGGGGRGGRGAAPVMACKLIRGSTSMVSRLFA